MVTKILLTLVVLVVAYLYLKRRAAKPSQPKRQEVSGPDDMPFRLIAIVFLLVSFFVTCAFFAYNWFDGRQLLEVKLISPDSSEQIYQVYKSDLEERSFISTDGQIIRISNQERMQIRKLEP